MGLAYRTFFIGRRGIQNYRLSDLLRAASKLTRSLLGRVVGELLELTRETG